MGLASLPKPKNDFELVLPDEVEDEEEPMEEELSAEDAEERDRKIRAAEEAQRIETLNRRSQVLQRNLPRPKHVNPDTLYKEVSETTDPIEKLIAEEMARLIVYDASKHPLSERPPAAPKDFLEISSAEIQSAREMIAKELPPTHIPGFEPELWDEDDGADLDSIPPSLVERKLTKQAPIDNKLEKKLNLTLGGYASRHGVLGNKIKEVTAAIEQARIDLEVYRALQAAEQVAAPARLASLVEEVEILETRERDGQRRYRELSEMKAELMRGVTVNGA